MRITTALTRIGITAAAALATGLIAAPASAASAADQTYTFVPIHLQVDDIEDAWPDWADEPRMYYGGAVWADVVQYGGYSGVIPPVDFTGSTMRVDLWERDRNWTDSNYLGGETVTSYNLGQEQELRFHNYWWSYTLRYKVVAKP
jgi:hypothetical protein